jgi:hypothetical protein
MYEFSSARPLWLSVLITEDVVGLPLDAYTGSRVRLSPTQLSRLGADRRVCLYAPRKRLRRERSEARVATMSVSEGLDRKRRGVDELRRDGGAGERLRSRIGAAE